MAQVQMTEISSRLGNFCVIRIGGAVFLTPCDTRMKVIGALAKRGMTADELARATGAAYSTVMDHLDVLERVGLVTPFLKREGGRRRIHFGLSEHPMERMEELFAKKSGKRPISHDIGPFVAGPC